MMYRDIEYAIDHTPELAAPWALMVQYLLPYDPDTARLIWDGFADRFVVGGRLGAHVEVVPESGKEDIRATCLAAWLALEMGDLATHEALLRWIDDSYEPRASHDEFAYWFHLGDSHPRGQWNNSVMNAFVAVPGTWSSLLERPADLG